jgi:benzoate-CoA ligase
MSSTLDDTPIYPDQLNIAARLTEGALEAGWGGRVALRSGGREVTYAEVRDEVACWAGVLEELGVAPEQRVLVALADTPSFITAFLGAIWGGAVAVPVNPYLPLDRYEYYLKDSRSVAAVVAPWLGATVAEARQRLPGLRHIVIFDEEAAARGSESGSSSTGGGPRPGAEVLDGAELLGAARPVASASTHCDEPAFWLYTSGSTGAPKGAIHLHHDIWVSAECWGRRTLDLSTDCVHLSASKLYFAYGLGNSLHVPMWTGGSAVLVPEKPTPENMVDAIEEHGVTHFYGVPSFYNAMMAERWFDARVEAGALSSLQACVSAGEALPAPLCERWMQRTGVPLLDGIGSTELLHLFITNRIDDIRPGCSGKPISGYRARVVGETGEDVAPDEVGDLWVCGDSACAGYWNRHAETKAAVRGEWFVTGDKYRRDESGYFWYMGRADDMFKVHGQWVSPALVESTLLEHDRVHEVAVVSSADDGGLACGVAHVVAVGPVEEGFASELRRYATARLSGYMVPASFEFVDELPKTPTGKIQRFLLRS